MTINLGVRTCDLVLLYSILYLPCTRVNIKIIKKNRYAIDVQGQYETLQFLKYIINYKK